MMRQNPPIISQVKMPLMTQFFHLGGRPLRAWSRASGGLSCPIVLPMSSLIQALSSVSLAWGTLSLSASDSEALSSSTILLLSSVSDIVICKVVSSVFSVSCELSASALR